VIGIRKKTKYGRRRRIEYFLFPEEGVRILESTIRNILRRNNLTRK